MGMGLIELDLCTVQGRLFELALRGGYEIEGFVDKFMASSVARGLDSDYNRLQWSGEEYILHRVEEECELVRGDSSVDPAALFWIGYLYRYWHLTTGESSREISAQADCRRMLTVYPGYHTLSCEMAINRIKASRPAPDAEKR